MPRKPRKRTHAQYTETTEHLNAAEHQVHSSDGLSIASPKDAKLADWNRPSGAPEGVYHYQSVQQVPEDIARYFYQRHKIFTLYDQGIWMTNPAWYGVTQEAVADKIARHVNAAVKEPERQVVLDIMAGAGGNTIAFAKLDRFTRIYAFEKDPATMECAKHNAAIYGVEKNITFFTGNCFELLAEQKGLQVLARQFGVIFCSPPWGGPSYRQDEIFDLNKMEPYSLKKLYDELKMYTDHIVLYLPRTSDLRQIADLVGPGMTMNVIHYCTEGSSRALCVYLGPFDFTEP